MRGIFTAAALALLASPAAALCTDFGQVVICNGEVVKERPGRAIEIPDSPSRPSFGGSDRNPFKFGGRVHRSDPPLSGVTIGGSTYFNDGSSCTTIGAVTSCN